MGLFDWLTGGAKRADVTAQETVPVIAAPPGPADILAALDAAERQAVDGDVPPAVLSRIQRVTSAVRRTMPRLDTIGWGSADAYSLMATATDYLPEAVGSYLRLPRDWADSRPIDGGKTALMLLIDQLDLLGATMDKIDDAVNQLDASALIAHGRFLQEKFGTGPTASPVTQAPVVRSTNPLDL